MAGGRSEMPVWLLIKHRDDWAGDVDITEFAPRSVKSDGDFEDILGEDNAGGLALASARAGRRGRRDARQDHRARREPESQPHGAGVQEKAAARAPVKRKTTRAKK